jgi:cell division protein FtsW (lipid II flippase)
MIGRGARKDQWEWFLSQWIFLHSPNICEPLHNTHTTTTTTITTSSSSTTMCWTCLMQDVWLVACLRNYSCWYWEVITYTLYIVVCPLTWGLFCQPEYAKSYIWCFQFHGNIYIYAFQHRIIHICIYVYICISIYIYIYIYTHKYTYNPNYVTMHCKYSK